MTPEMSLNSAICVALFLELHTYSLSSHATRSTLAVFLAIGISSCREFVHEFLRRLTSVTCHAYYNYLVLSNACERSFLCLSCKQFSEHRNFFFKECQVKSEYNNHQLMMQQDRKEFIST